MFDHLEQKNRDTDYYRVVAKVRERLTLNKQKTTQISYGEVQSQEFKLGRG
jgi:hypothetical protein